jgi:ArsR family transcriptional regulator, nickel/cobalt-responsive transcriptional repressor
MPHPTEHSDAGRPFDPGEAEELAEAMRIFGTASRLRLMWALLGGERTVEELSEDAGLSASAASHQLRILRAARVVRVRRDGRRAYYALHDHHVADLLGAIRHHREHVHGLAEAPTPARRSARA